MNMTILFCLLGFQSLALAQPHPPHLDLEMSSKEYQVVLNEVKNFFPGALADEPEIARALELGSKLASWIQVLNSERPADRQLRLTSATTRVGIPLTQPSQYNPTLIQSRIDTVLNEMPKAMKQVLTLTDGFPNRLETIGLSDEDFILYGRKLDRQYQSAARWKTLKNWRSWYEQAQSRDVRGYYHLQQEKWTADQIAQFASLTPETQARIKPWLVQICRNADFTFEDCELEFERSRSENRLEQYFEAMMEAAQENWESFFFIPMSAARSDIQWNSSTAGVAQVPFNTPSQLRIQNYLSSNIEDEFRWKDWAMKLVFGEYPYGPRVVFEPGVVPHVNALGGNEIVMDENQPIEEYESQWTIRHEFGHVLGLPDCYHEFYDTESESFINYQIDTSDLMCSRAGNMNERIYLELKNAYFK
jgi:hypothetical protein